MNAPTMTTPGTKPKLRAKPRVRDRIFDTACELFYRHGIRSVGVDAIAAEAGTNKMSFYRSFPSKDELVAEYLREQQREFWEHWDAAHRCASRQSAPADRGAVRSTSGAVEDKACRGCALGNAAVEIADDDDVLSELVRHFKKEVRQRLRKHGARDGRPRSGCSGRSADAADGRQLFHPPGIPGQQRPDCRTDAARCER